MIIYRMSDKLVFLNITVYLIDSVQCSVEVIYPCLLIGPINDTDRVNPDLNQYWNIGAYYVVFRALFAIVSRQCEHIYLYVSGHTRKFHRTNKSDLTTTNSLRTVRIIKGWDECIHKYIQYIQLLHYESWMWIYSFYIRMWNSI